MLIVVGSNIEVRKQLRDSELPYRRNFGDSLTGKQQFGVFDTSQPQSSARSIGFSSGCMIVSGGAGAMYLGHEPFLAGWAGFEKI